MATTGHDTTRQPRSHPRRITVLELVITAVGSALVVGVVLGVFSLQEDAGNAVRTGTPWVVAAFALGALIGHRGRGHTAPLTSVVACLAAVVALTIANGIYYGVVNPLFDQFAQPWTIVGIGVGALFGLGGHAWGRDRTSTAATIAVGVVSVVVMVEAIGWQIIGDRSFAPTTMLLLVLVGLALPRLLLPTGRRLQGTVIAGAAVLPFLVVMIGLGAA